MAESEEEVKSLLMKMKEESERAGLKFNTDIGGQPSASADLSEFVAWLRGVSLPGRLWTGGLGFSPQRHFHGAL